MINLVVQMQEDLTIHNFQVLQILEISLTNSLEGGLIHLEEGEEEAEEGVI